MEKVVEVQQQVKNNASDLSAYMRDLDNWTQQMQAKDQQLIQAKNDRKANLTEKSSAPSRPIISPTIIKESASSPPKKPKTDSAGGGSSSTVKIAKQVKPRDYSDWDKFDVEAACEEVEKAIENISKGDSSSEDEELQDERKLVEAVAEKERGNEWLKKGNYDKAIEKYTRGND